MTTEDWHNVMYTSVHFEERLILRYVEALYFVVAVWMGGCIPLCVCVCVHVCVCECACVCVCVCRSCTFANMPLIYHYEFQCIQLWYFIMM